LYWTCGLQLGLPGGCRSNSVMLRSKISLAGSRMAYFARVPLPFAKPIPEAGISTAVIENQPAFTNTRVGFQAKGRKGNSFFLFRRCEFSPEKRKSA
jgi:hypothetical protein